MTGKLSVIFMNLVENIKNLFFYFKDRQVLKNIFLIKKELAVGNYFSRVMTGNVEVQSLPDIKYNTHKTLPVFTHGRCLEIVDQLCIAT